MVSQPQLIQDSGEQLTGLELEALTIVIPININIFTGLVLLAEISPTSRGVFTSMVTSTATSSPTRSSLYALAFQSKLRSLAEQ